MTPARPGSDHGRGGQGGREPRATVQARALRVLDRSVAGLSQRQIAAAEGLTQSAVSKILRRLETRAWQELVDRVEQQKARQSLRLDYLYGESLRAWEASKVDATRRVQRTTQAGAGGAVGATVAQLVVETPTRRPALSRGGAEGVGGPAARLGARCAPETGRPRDAGTVRGHDRCGARGGARAPATTPHRDRERRADRGAGGGDRCRVISAISPRSRENSSSGWPSGPFRPLSARPGRSWNRRRRFSRIGTSTSSANTSKP